VNNNCSLSNAALDLEHDLSDSLDGSSNKFHVDVLRVLLKLEQDLLRVTLIGDLDENFNFFKFDVHWIVKLAIEHLDVVFEDLWLLLKDKANVSQGDILNLGLASQKRNQGCGELFDDSLSHSVFLYVIDLFE
jgi:hypothetical protein